MFCYIKYSLTTIHAVRMSKINTNYSSDIVLRKGKSTVVRYKREPSINRRTTMWRSIIIDPKVVASMNSSTSDTSAQPGQDEQICRLTNQLAFEKSMNILQTLRKRVSTGSNLSRGEKSSMGKNAIDQLEEDDQIRTITSGDEMNEVRTSTLQRITSDGSEMNEIKSETTTPKKGSVSSNKASKKIYTPNVRNINTTGNSASLTDTNNIMMINPDCYMKILIDYIAKQLHIDKTMHIDLCDENGNMMKLYELKPYDNAKERLEHRKIYTLIAYEMDSITKSYTTLVPLIKRTNKDESNLLMKLRHTLVNESKAFKRGSTHSLNNYTEKSGSKTKVKSRNASKHST